MRFLALSTLTGLVAASPIAVVPSAASIDGKSLEPRQLGFSGFGKSSSSSSSSSSNSFSISNDLVNGNSQNCPKAIFIFARATLEPGNMGVSLGPLLSSSLSHSFPNTIWTQGVGAPYNADFASNYLPGGASKDAIDEVVRLLEMAGSKCPGSRVVVGGYSQGSAAVAAALGRCGEGVRKQVVGTVLFGYTQNAQNHGIIPGFPTEETKIFCARGDLVCSGNLMITPLHFSYAGDATGEAAEFLKAKIRA